MYLCLYHPENGRDTDNVIKWITFRWLIETMLDHVTVVFSYATAIVLIDHSVSMCKLTH